MTKGRRGGTPALEHRAHRAEMSDGRAGSHLADHDVYGGRLTDIAALRRIGDRFELAHCALP
jgi:hypothetical protein